MRFTSTSEVQQPREDLSRMPASGLVFARDVLRRLRWCHACLLMLGPVCCSGTSSGRRRDSSGRCPKPQHRPQLRRSAAQQPGRRHDGASQAGPRHRKLLRRRGAAPRTASGTATKCGTSRWNPASRRRCSPCSCRAAGSIAASVRPTCGTAAPSRQCLWQRPSQPLAAAPCGAAAGSAWTPRRRRQRCWWPAAPALSSSAATAYSSTSQGSCGQWCCRPRCRACCRSHPSTAGGCRRGRWCQPRQQRRGAGHWLE